MGSLFSERERRALLWFLPLAGLFTLVGARMKPRPEPADARRVEERMEHAADTVERFRFDPNTVTYGELRRLGVPKRAAVSLLRYRAGGKVFRIPEEVAACYGFTDSLYYALEPLIRIDARYAPAPRAFGDSLAGSVKTRRRRGVAAFEPFAPDTASVAYFVRVGFSPRQAEVILRYRDACGGFYDLQTFANCYVVGDSLAQLLAPCLVFEAPDADAAAEVLIELNGADSAVLRSVSGIGEKTVGRIMEYRSRLGGYHSVRQLAEVEGVNERNYERIVQQIWCDSCKIRKIDINFAPPERLASHPYIRSRTLRRLLSARQLKGGWSTPEELLEDHIFTPEELSRLAPYLRFSPAGGAQNGSCGVSAGSENGNEGY